MSMSSSESPPCSGPACRRGARQVRFARLAIVLGLVWAFPWTLLGLGVGLLGLATGGWCRRRGRVVEFHGGGVTWLLERAPVRPSAMTLGHTVLGRTPEMLDRAREHELVHVRQYERWGLLFVPAYLLASLGVWLQGKHAYYDNPFEREAYRIAP